ncbi:MAG: diaminopimelate decarboxylase, partial [Gammaproteobacteria bacterium]
MSSFLYCHGRLYAAEVPLSAIAEAVGTPSYIYIREDIEERWRAFDEAFAAHPHCLCYAVKANSNLAVLKLLADLGSGFDIVSGGELSRVLKAGGDPSRIVFSGVGKKAWEMEQALKAGIACFNVESEPELERLSQVAAGLGKTAPFALRINPHVDPKTHPYIATGLEESKFGIDEEGALALYEKAARLPFLEPVGVDCHIGSQLTTLGPFAEALEKILNLAERLRERGLPIRHLDAGGGLGIRYRDESPPSPEAYADTLLRILQGRDYTLFLEPGRAIVGEAGVLLTRVEYIKVTPKRRFAIVDAAMNDLLRPALYGAWHDILEVEPEGQEPHLYDVVGPVCETGDFLGKDRRLRIAPGDLLAVASA